MRTSDIIRRAGQNLSQAKVRTFLTALAISVGAFTITLAFAAGNGGKQYTDTLLSSNGDSNSITVYQKQERPGEKSGPEKYGASDQASGQVFLSDKDVSKVEKIKGVAKVEPMLNVTAEYIQGPNGEKYKTGVTVKIDKSNLSLAAGSLNDNQLGVGKIAISKDYVSALGFSSPEAAIGKDVVVNVAKNSLVEGQESKDISYKISAVVKDSATTLRNSSGIWISSQDGVEIYDYKLAPGQKGDQYFALVVSVDKTADVGVVKDKIKDAGYDAMTMQDIQQILFTFVDVVMGGAAGFGALAIIASIFGIINTQYISVLERTQQIGLMKALGARSRDIGRLFRYEAAWVGFLGGVLGTLLALPLGLLNPWIANTLNLDDGTRLLIFDPLTSLVLIVSLMLVSIVAGWLPSRKAAKLDPIEALRTE